MIGLKLGLCNKKNYDNMKPEPIKERWRTEFHEKMQDFNFAAGDLFAYRLR